MDFSNTPIEQLAARVAAHLQQQGIEVVLTRNLYLTKDIDMVNTNYQKPKVLHAAMAELGFRKQGRVYVNDTTEITVEFPPGPLSVGDEMIQQSTIVQLGDGYIPIMVVEDVVKDRLAAFIHWQDHQSLVQAVAVILNHDLRVEDFSAFCQREGSAGSYQLLQQLSSRAIHQGLTTMEQLQAELTLLLLNAL